MTGSLTAGADPSAEIDPAGGQGRVEHQAYSSSTGEYDYLVYLPQAWSIEDRLPLYVMVHGCGTTAEQQMNANLLNPIADRERFVVAYLDNGGGCWRSGSNDVLLAPLLGGVHPARGTGGDVDTDAVAGMTEEVIGGYGIDAERVYIIGMSSGAFQASSAAAVYPDIYAAAGVSAGGGYGMSILCLSNPEQIVPLYADATVSQMGERARVVPFFSIGGDGDPLGEQQTAPGVGGCSHLAFQEWLAVNNAVDPAGDYRPDPSSTEQGQVPNGHAWTRHAARGADGCQVAERWIVHGMGHYWSGGTTDPTYTEEQENGPGFNDPRGPSASQASWDFFKQFTLSGGNTACSAVHGEAGPAPTPPTPPTLPGNEVDHGPRTQAAIDPAPWALPATGGGELPMVPVVVVLLVGMTLHRLARWGF